MANRVYFGTNIFIDFLDITRPGGKDSLEKIRVLIREKKLLFINSDTVTNAYYVLFKTKKYSNEKLLELIKKAVSLFEIVPIKNKEVLIALDYCSDNEEPFYDYEDAMQYVCAKKVDADLIVTNDKKFISPNIEISTTNHN